LALRRNLPEDLGEAIQDALGKHLRQSPAITVKCDLSTPAESKAVAPGVFIGRPKTSGNAPAVAPGGEIQVWVRHMSIDPKHVAIQQTASGRWEVSSWGKTPVRIEADGERTVVNQGETREIQRNVFTLKIAICRFDFKAEDGPQEKIGKVEFTGPAAGDASTEQLGWFRVLGNSLEMRGPEGQWAGHAGQLRQATEAAWERFRDKHALPGTKSFEWCDRATATPQHEYDTRHVKVSVSGVEKNLEIRIPVPFYDALWRKLMETGLESAAKRLERQVGWWRIVTAGEQRVPLERLKELRPESVIVLAKNSASVLDPVFWERRQLIRQMPGSGPAPKATFLIGEMVPHTIRSRGAGAGERSNGENRMENRDPANDGPDTSSIEVKVEVVLPAERLTIAELTGWNKDRVIEANLGEGAEVGIAINGEILGRGKIVRTPGDRMGVQVMVWYV
jgi:flagellar motor switch/type III secretory pathway protein FliN